MKLNSMWLRRQTTKFNGVSFIVQKGAEAVFTEDGRKQIKENIAYYRKNAKIITSALDELGIWYTGGKNSPYIWLRCPNDMDSWAFFDMLLSEIGVVGTPGAGFGKNAGKFFRLTAFSTNENTAEAMEKLRSLLKKVRASCEGSAVYGPTGEQKNCKAMEQKACRRGLFRGGMLLHLYGNFESFPSVRSM